MATHSTSSGVGLEKAMRHWRERGALLELPKPEKAIRGFTIAVSRESGAGGQAIAKAIAAELDWPLYDRELIEKIAEDTGVQASLLSKLDEQRPNWLAECWEGFSREKHVSAASLAIQMRKVLLALYCHGECVVLGRGAAQILPDAQSFCVRLIAPEAVRIKRFAEKHGVDEKEAAQRVNAIDRGRDDFVRSHFHRDPSDPYAYDLCVNTGRIDQSTCVSALLAAFEGRRSRA